MKITTVEKYGENGYKLYRIPCIVCTGKGTLLTCYEARHGSDWGVLDVILRRKSVGADEWSERICVADSLGRSTMNNPVLFTDGDTIHMLHCKNYRYLYYTKSTDDGLTWTKAREITDVPEALLDKYNWTVCAVGPGHGLTTSGGRLIAPMWFARNTNDINTHGPNAITTIYSDDHGETWHCGEIIYSTEEFVNPNESTLAELSDGRIMMNCRHVTKNNMRAVLISEDGRGGWSDVYFDENLPDPICQGSLAQADDGILFTNCAATMAEGRTHTTVRHSSDDGKTWDKAYEVARYGGYSDVCYDPVSKTVCAFAESGRVRENDAFSFDLVVTEFSWDEV